MEAPIFRPFLFAIIGPPEEVVVTIDDSSRALNQRQYFNMNITMNMCT